MKKNLPIILWATFLIIAYLIQNPTIVAILFDDSSSELTPVPISINSDEITQNTCASNNFVVWQDKQFPCDQNEFYEVRIHSYTNTGSDGTRTNFTIFGKNNLSFTISGGINNNIVSSRDGNVVATPNFQSINVWNVGFIDFITYNFYFLSLIMYILLFLKPSKLPISIGIILIFCFWSIGATLITLVLFSFQGSVILFHRDIRRSHEEPAKALKATRIDRFFLGIFVIIAICGTLFSYFRRIPPPDYYLLTSRATKIFSINSDGSLIAAMNRDDNLGIWKSGTQIVEIDVAFASEILAFLRFSINDQFLLVMTSDGSVFVWSLE